MSAPTTCTFPALQERYIAEDWKHRISTEKDPADCVWELEAYFRHERYGYDPLDTEILEITNVPDEASAPRILQEFSRFGTISSIGIYLPQIERDQTSVGSKR